MKYYYVLYYVIYIIGIFREGGHCREMIDYLNRNNLSINESECIEKSRPVSS
jgi:hypothetical protein